MSKEALKKRCKVLVERLKMIHRLIETARNHNEEIPWRIILEITEGDVGEEDENAIHSS